MIKYHNISYYVPKIILRNITAYNFKKCYRPDCLPLGRSHTHARSQNRGSSKAQFQTVAHGNSKNKIRHIEENMKEEGSEISVKK